MKRRHSCKISRQAGTLNAILRLHLSRHGGRIVRPFAEGFRHDNDILKGRRSGRYSSRC